MSIFKEVGANWIWSGKTSNLQNQYCEFIQNINIASVSGDAKVYISATSDYVLYINGKYVANRQYHDYPNNKSFDTIDVSKSLVVGNNKIAVLGYNFGESTFAYIKDTAGIIYVVENGKEIFTSGKDVYFRMSPTYKQGDMEKVSPQLGYTFEYDNRKSDDWTSTSYKMGSDWQQVSDADIMDKTYNFFPRPIAKLENIVKSDAKIIVAGSFIRKYNEGTAAKLVQQDFLGNSIVESKISLPVDSYEIKQDDFCDGTYFIVDMEKNISGNISLDFVAEKDTVIEVVYGEHLDDNRVRGQIHTRCFGFRFFAKEGENKFIHRMLRFAGRYIEVHITGKAKFNDVRIISTDYPAPLKSTYDSVNSLENKINEVAVRTLRICMHEHFEDTPWREQGLYGMDSRNQALCNYYSLADYDFIKACLRTFSGSFGKDGFQEITSPTQFDFTIPCFTFAWIMMVKDYLLYSGDYDFAKEMLPFIKNTLDKVSDTIDETGIVPTIRGDRYWNFTEWSDGMSDDERDCGDYTIPYNAFYMYSMDSMIYIMENLGENADSYKAIADGVRSKIHDLFWVEDKGYYKTHIGGKYPIHFAQLTGALALLAGFVPSDKEKIVREKIVNDNTLIESTISMCTYKYEALLQDADYADVIFDEIEKVWGYMIYNKATTFWETIKGGWDFGCAGSLSHAWSAMPLYFYNAYLLGVKPTKPGFKEYEIKPVKKAYINAKIYTPNGYIEVNNK